MPPRVVIAEHDPLWLELFQGERERIGAILGQRTLRSEHAGSTSVSGLAAKPVTDIVLVVADSAAEEAYVRDLESAGYSPRVCEPDWFEHRIFKGPGTDLNLHVFSNGCPGIDRMLTFRNWLRRNHVDRELYQ
ncbi:MAG TPA: GrpB family protein [Bryobacteraceae bacterium]|nr:GrpB family protein [Bryobacteraceae bacterium]